MEYVPHLRVDLGDKLEDLFWKSCQRSGAEGWSALPSAGIECHFAHRVILSTPSPGRGLDSSLAGLQLWGDSVGDLHCRGPHPWPHEPSEVRSISINIMTMTMIITTTTITITILILILILIIVIFIIFNHIIISPAITGWTTLTCKNSTLTTSLMGNAPSIMHLCTTH